jgi:hypothetical protein
MRYQATYEEEKQQGREGEPGEGDSRREPTGQPFRHVGEPARRMLQNKFCATCCKI